MAVKHGAVPHFNGLSLCIEIPIEEGTLRGGGGGVRPITFELGVGEEGQDTSHFEGILAFIRAILPNVRPRSKNWGKNQNLN